EAARAWGEAVEARHGAARAELLRRLAGVFELQGAWERALATRRAAADAFAHAERPADAAEERLAAAAHLDSAGAPSEARELARVAAGEARVAERLDLQARAPGVDGTTQAKLGDLDAGLA